MLSQLFIQGTQAKKCKFNAINSCSCTEAKETAAVDLKQLSTFLKHLLMPPSTLLRFCHFVLIRRRGKTSRKIKAKASRNGMQRSVG